MENNEKGVKELKNERNAVIVISSIVILVLVLIIVLAVIQNINRQKLPQNVTYTHTTEDGVKTNKSEKLKEAKMLDGMVIKVTSLTEINNYTKILANVLNSTQETKGGYGVICILKDDKGNELTRIDGYISSVEPGKTVELNCSIIGSFANAYDISFEIENI